ncbi:MAG: sulfur carrier protein ThiS [Pyrinomonadaceae bacterium]|jgi:thiamine biosynthesis protein ThiS|nr:sulfur carrier protein ThiS [Blastocatellia bacterium]MCW5955306.1 sulfur carrier protein ThiS [Pyrinomonadaceae bacterium]
MTIFINGDVRELEGVETLSDLLDTLGLAKQRIAIEVNKKVIRKQEWETALIADQDKVEIVHFVGGG